jgi:hypothetical protein
MVMRGVLPQIAGRLLSVPVVTAFVALGAVVIVGRGIRGVWSYLRPEGREIPVTTMPTTQQQTRHAA